MRKQVFTLFIVFISFLSFANDYKIKGKVTAWNNQKIYLFGSYGDKFNLIDSVQTSAYGDFKIAYSKDLPKGLYRLVFMDNKYIELILNKENIVLKTHVSDPFNYLEFSESTENKIYHSYIKKRNYDQYRIELLQPVLGYYPLDDKFYPVLLQEFTNIQDSLDLYIDNIRKTKSNTFASKLIEIDRRPKLDPVLKQNMQKEMAKKQYFDKKSFNDTALLYTNVLTNNILSYLALYQNPKMSKEQVEKEFIKAVDIILPKMRTNKKIYEFVVEYLISGFEQFGLSQVITHIASQMDEIEDCSDQDLKHRIKTLKKLSKGNPAPDIKLKDLRLKDIQKNRTLILFYASWCPLCNELMPEIHNIYEAHKDDLEVVAISIDSVQADYQKYIDSNKFRWIQYCDLKAWETQAAIDYGVYVTPHMFLLDHRKRILGRPADLLELEILLGY